MKDMDNLCYNTEQIHLFHLDILELIYQNIYLLLLINEFHHLK